jgi:hypothetical protein
MINFPTSLDDNTTLFVAVNNLRTQLASGIDNSTLTIPVVTTSGYPSSGFISILTGTNITQTEAIRYTSLGGTQFNASQRGAGGTPAAAHEAGDNVDLTIVASHHNELKDAIIELEHFVGVSGSENFLPQGESGDVIISGTLTAGSGSFSNSLTVSGTPVDITGVGGLSNIVEDTTPQLGGDLDAQGFDISSIGNSTTVTGIFTQSLTVSGEPVVIGTSGFGFFEGIKAATVTTSTGITVPDDTNFVMFWDAERLDEGDWFDPAAPSRLTVPSGITHVQLTAGVRWAANSTGRRQVEITTSGSDSVGTLTQNALTTPVAHRMTLVTPVLTVSGGDFFELEVRQTSGGGLVISDAPLQSRNFFSILSVDSRGVGVNSVNLLQGDINVIAGSGISISTDSGTNDITVEQNPSIVATSGTFSESLTVSGEPVSTGGGVGTGFQSILVTEVSTPISTLTVSGIPSSCEIIEVQYQGRSTEATTIDRNVRLTFNDVSASGNNNYDEQSQYWDDAGTQVDVTNSPGDYIVVGRATGGSATADIFGVSSFTINQTTRKKALTGQSFNMRDEGAASGFISKQQFFGGQWRNTTSTISSIQLRIGALAGNWAPGSRLVVRTTSSSGTV